MSRSSPQSTGLFDPAAGTRPAVESTPALLVRSMRPEQWLKNVFVFAGLVFGGRLFELSAVMRAVAMFVVFCGLSGAVYLVNDVADREADRQHPLKRLRPIASGRLRPGTAVAAAALAAAGSMTGAFLIGPLAGLVGAGYLLLLGLYSTMLKHIVIVDVLAISGGFVLRAVGGAVAVDVPIGHWLPVCTTLLALFLALSKRRHELTLLAGDAASHRRILGEYSPYLLDQMIAVVTASTLIAYTVFVTSAESAERLGTTRMSLTVPFVLYGIFRYLYLVHHKQGGGSPAALILADRPLLACLALWSLTVAALMYTPLGG